MIAHKDRVYSPFKNKPKLSYEELTHLLAYLNGELTNDQYADYLGISEGSSRGSRVYTKALTLLRTAIRYKQVEVWREDG